MTTPEVRIDPEFRKLIPPLRPEELEQLETNLVAEGCRDPLVLWKGTLIDGHNRYEICTRLKIKFQTVEIVLASREHVLLWIAENQLGRRNLTDDQRGAIAVLVKERRVKLALSERAAKAREYGGKATPQEVAGRKDRLGANVAPKRSDRSHKSSVQVAKAAHVSERKVREIEQVRKASPQAFERIVTGETTLRDVKRDLRDTERQVKLDANRKLVETAAPAELIPGHYSAIVIDPPWDWGDEGDADQFGRARPTYATMPIEEIAALPVNEWAAKNAHLYLWITNRSLPKGFALLERWGFRYVTVLTWCKPSIGMGNYFRGSTEHVLFGVRGSLPLLARDVGTYFAAPRPKGHSAKPREFYELVERCSPGPFLDVFARSPRDGWTLWGAEAVGVA